MFTPFWQTNLSPRWWILSLAAITWPQPLPEKGK